MHLNNSKVVLPQHLCKSAWELNFTAWLPLWDPVNSLYPRPLIFRICLIPSQYEVLRYQGRMSNFIDSNICIFSRNTIHTPSCYIAVCGSLHTSMIEVTRSCCHFSSLFCYCFFIYFLLLFCILLIFFNQEQKTV